MPTFSNEPRTETIYNYDADGVYLSRENKVIPPGTDIPAHATTIAPPNGAGRRVPVFNPQTQAWALVNDFRGADVFDTATGRKTTVETLGDLPANLTDTAPDEEGDDDAEKGAKEWDGSRWVVNLTRFKNAAIARVIDAAKNARKRGLKTLGARDSELNHLTRVMSAWVSAGSDLGALPVEFAVHVDAGGLTPTEAVNLVNTLLANATDIEREVYVMETTGVYAIEDANARGQIRAAVQAAITALNGLYP